MSKTARLFTLAFVLSAAYAHSNPTWNATIKVIDEAKQPLADADVVMGWYVNTADGYTSSEKVEGLTDTNGLFKTSHEANRSITLGFFASKTGYYSTGTSHEIAPLNDSDPAKWNHNVTLILKKIHKPVAMYAKQIDSLELPQLNKVIGYDLTVGDWIAPYGKGINADLFFTEAHTNPQSGYIISVSFPNAGDGIQEFTVPDTEKGSALRSAQEAPVNGYQSTIAQTQTTNPNRNFYFRVHTKLDSNGNEVSARYGKIYGDLAQFTYYYNPTPNDRDVEFNPKQNLLSSEPKVTAP